jgi:ABC-type sugar transport system permease subunit
MALSDVGPTNLLKEWEFVGTANLEATLSDRVFWDAVRATTVFTVVLLTVDLVVGFVVARLLARQGSRLVGAVLALMVLVWALPPVVSGSVWKFLLAGDGAVNALLGIVGLGPVGWLSSPDLALLAVSLVAAWASLPFAVLIIRGGLLAIPPEVLEAAELDGAGSWRLSRSILLPLLRPTLAVLTILVILYAFRSFDFVYVMTQGGPGRITNTLPYLAYQTSFKTFSFGSGASVAVLSMVVVALLAIPYVANLRREERA